MYEDHASCSVFASRHFLTFDKKHFTFPGEGTYTLVQDCKGSSTPEYQVFINQTYDCIDNDCKVAVKVSFLLPAGKRLISVNIKIHKSIYIT